MRGLRARSPYALFVKDLYAEISAKNPGTEQSARVMNDRLADQSFRAQASSSEQEGVGSVEDLARRQETSTSRQEFESMIDRLFRADLLEEISRPTDALRAREAASVAG